MLLVMVTGFIILLFSYEFIVLLLDQKYQGALIFIPVLVTAYLFQQGGVLVGKFYKQSKKTKQEAIFALITAGINLLLNIIVVPQYGAIGAAYTTLVSFALGFIITYLYAKRNCYFIPFKWSFLAIVISISATIILLSIQISNHVGIITSLTLKILLTGVIGLFFIKKYYAQIKVIFEK